MVDVEFLTDPALFLRRAEAVLAADPVVTTVVSTVSARFAAEDADGVPLHPGVPRWWALMQEAGAIVGLAMRTAPAPPHALYLLPMPDAAAEALADALHARGEPVEHANGALPATRRFMERVAGHRGGRIEVAQHNRLFELRELVPARPVAGELRRTEDHEVDLALAWYDAFLADADEQAGRVRGTSAPAEVPTREDILRRIRGGQLWFWTDGDGTPVNLTAANPPGFGVSRLGPVYTPPEQRGRGFASAAVAELSTRLLGEGVRVCLFTDQANPTSNGIYQALGFRPVVDMANLVVTPAG